MHVLKSKHNLVSLVFASLIVSLFVVGFQSNADAKSKLPATPPAGSSFSQRVEFRKKEYQVKLNQDQQQQLQSECAQAQSVLSGMNSTAEATLAKYNQTYTKVDGIVLVNIGQLKISGQPTFDFASQEKVLAQKAGDFSSLSRNYLQALNDSITINCAKDPNGFQALVDTVRGYYQGIIDQSNDIANYTNNTVRTTLEGYVGKVGN